MVSNQGCEVRLGSVLAVLLTLDREPDLAASDRCADELW